MENVTVKIVRSKPHTFDKMNVLVRILKLHYIILCIYIYIYIYMPKVSGLVVRVSASEPNDTGSNPGAAEKKAPSVVPDAEFGQRNGLKAQI